MTQDGRPASSTVRIELKEVVEIEDMVLANLTTTSNGQPLESGGMLYLQATQNGQPLQLRPDATIEVELRSKNKLPKMMAFTGVEDSLGRINWVNPSPVMDSTTRDVVDQGRILFRINCAPCHALTSVVVGPPLLNIHTRRPMPWLVSFIKNSSRLIQKGDKQAVALYQQYNNTPMPSFTFNNEEIKALLAYCSSQPFPADSLRALNKKFVGVDSTVTVDEGDALSIDTTADYTYFDPYYVLETNEMGWINIDRFLENEQYKPIPFTVKVDQAKKLYSVNVVLVFQKRAVFIQAFDQKEDLFTFSREGFSGLTKLPIGEEAVLISTAKKGKTPYFGMKSIMIGANKQEVIQLKPSTEQAITKAIKEKL